MAVAAAELSNAENDLRLAIKHLEETPKEGFLSPKEDKKKLDPLNLHGSKEKNWVDKYFDTKELRTLERTLLIG